MLDAERGRPRPADDSDLAEIDLGLLLALEALLHERNVTRAASRLNIGQPALSARLNRLRQVFADPLFVPATSGRGVVPTARAVELQTELAAVLGKLRRMVEGPAVFDPARSQRTFVVAIHEIQPLHWRRAWWRALPRRPRERGSLSFTRRAM